MNFLPKRIEDAENQPILQGYTLQKQLGEGGFGVTYLARENSSGAAYVVKHLRFEKVDSWKDVELFEREARILQNLNHPRIPGFKDLVVQRDGEREDLLLIQDYIAGETLEQSIESGKRQSEKEVAKMGLQMADVLEYLHGLNPPVIHRDIKPANIMLKRSGECFLVDFGAVRDQVKQSRGSTMIGTFGYMAPEQFDGRAYPATDIYALGVSLIYALTHTAPGEMEKENFLINYRPHGQISHRLSLILDKMIAPNWKDRFQDAGELRQALQDFLAGKKVQLQTEHETETKKSKGSLLAALTAGGISILVLLFLYALIPSSSPTQTPEAAQPAQQSYDLSSDMPEGLKHAKWRGELRWNGQLMRDFEPEQVKFWFRNEKTRTQMKNVKGHYYKGHIWFDLLPDNNTEVLINVIVHNDEGWAGGFERSQSFNLFHKTPYLLNLELNKVIHLTAPVDNMQTLKVDQLSSPKNPESIPAYSEPIHFAWESLGPDINYQYQVERRSFENGQYKNLGKVYDETTPKNELYLGGLSPTKGSEYYRLKLYAYGQHGRMGILITHASDGRRSSKSWHYDFRVN